MNPLIRTTPRRRSTLIASLAATLLLSASVDAQQPSAGAWRIEPTVGIWRQADQTGDVLSQPRHVGPAFGLAVSRQQNAGLRFTASGGYHRLDDAAQVRQMTPTGQPRTDVYDMEIVSVTAGAAADLWQGGASAVAIGFEMGAGWQRHPLDRSSGPSTAPFLGFSYSGDWNPGFLMVPSIAARRAVATRLELIGSARLLLAIGDLQPDQIPIITLGTAYRF